MSYNVELVSRQIKWFPTIYIYFKMQAARRKGGKKLFYNKAFFNNFRANRCTLSLCVTPLAEKIWENAQSNWLTSRFFFLFCLFKPFCFCKTYGEKQCSCGWIVPGTMLSQWKGKMFFTVWWQMQEFHLGSAGETSTWKKVCYRLQNLPKKIPGLKMVRGEGCWGMCTANFCPVLTVPEVSAHSHHWKQSTGLGETIGLFLVDWDFKEKKICLITRQKTTKNSVYL